MTKRIIVQSVIAVAAVGILGFGLYNVLPLIFADEVYPLEYVGEINQCADLFGLDKPLLAALILKESGFNPQAVSRAGAMGLTQVMPATFRGIISRTPELQGQGLDPGNPFDPKTNICAGAAYLAGAMANYDGDWTAALISYNGGDSAARRYLASRSVAGLVAETRSYAPKILAAREAYASLYADRLPPSGTPGSSSGAAQPAPTPTPVTIRVQTRTEKVKAFWKGLVSNPFARYVD